MYRIHEIENAVIERIKAANLPYLRFVGSYGGELMGDWQSVIRSLPAVWVTFKGSGTPAPLNTAHTRWRVELRFTTIVAAKSLRSEKATRHGGKHGPQDAGQPRNGSAAKAAPFANDSECRTGRATERHSIGSYQLLNDIGRIIALQDFNLDGVDYLRPRDIRSLFNAGTGAQALSVFAQNWTTLVDIHLQEPCAAPLSPSLPDDDPADSTGYLPPAGETFPGTSYPRYQPMETLALRYWLKPPQDPQTDPPLMQDLLTLNIQL